MIKPRAYTPLFNSSSAPSPPGRAVGLALGVAREALTDRATENIHSHGAMIVAATDLYLTLRQLVIALDAERGEV